MSDSGSGEFEQQDEVPVEDALEQSQEVEPADTDDESRLKGDDVVQAPEGEFPADARGYDGATIEEILEDREQRLAVENRPENSEVSNAGREFDGEKGMFHDEPGFDEAEKKFTLDES